MMTENEVAATSNLPDSFPVTVIMERRPAQVSQWVDYIWSARGIAVGNLPDTQEKLRVTHMQDDVLLHFYSGYQIRLHVDECDSYYHNLMSPSPQCYIVVRQDQADDYPRPFIISLSFDEAHSYLEGDDTVFTVDIPPELYRWTETFVLTHYCPEQRKKRKRRDWSNKHVAPVNR